jgi:hypothetical protein
MEIRDLQTGEVRTKRFDFHIYYSKFLKVDTCFYFLRSKDTHYLTDSEGNNYFVCPEVFSRKRAKVQNALVRNSDRIYFINQYASNIYGLNLLTKEELTIPMKGIKNVFDWHAIYDEEKGNSFFESKENRYTTFSTLNVIVINQKEYFLLNTYRRKGKKARFLLVNNKGEVLININAEKHYVMAVNNNAIFMLSETDEGELLFHEFNFTEKINKIIAGDL